MEPPGELTTSLRKFGALRSAARNFCSSPKSISPVIVIVAASVVAKVAASTGVAGTKVARPRAIAAADANPLTVLRRVVMDLAFRGRWFGRGDWDRFRGLGAFAAAGVLAVVSSASAPRRSRVGELKLRR